MKPVYALLLLLVIGCNSNNTPKIETNESFNKIDSIINQSKQNNILLDQASRESDSSITQKVDKTVKQITTLKTEVKQLKAENNALKTKLNDASNAGEPFKLLPVSNN
jgi:t-SNARE complex subunit (syntaxin)